MDKITETDNNYLEELIEHEITPQMEKEFFEVLKKSQLFLPVTFGDEVFEGLEDAKPGDVIDGPRGFSINYIEDDKGNRIVPLYTSDEKMAEAGVRLSVMVMYAEDLAHMLSQTEKYAVISINPFCECDINMPVGAFLDIFTPSDEFEEVMNTILDLLKDKSVELEKDYAFFLRSDDDFMKTEAVDGVFTPMIPFNISSREDFQEDMKFLNILLFNKSKKILYVGDAVGDEGYDTIIAPETEFEFVKDLDEYTRVWKCGAQPFYDYF